jgi:hypothetical protein
MHLGWGVEDKEITWVNVHLPSFSKKQGREQFMLIIRSTS